MSDIFEFELVSAYEEPRRLVLSRQELEKRLKGQLKMLRDGYWKLRDPHSIRLLWGFLFLFCLGAIGFSFIDIPKVTVPEHFANIFRFFFGALSLLFLYFYKNSDSYILIDQTSGKLLRILKFFSKEYTTELANFSDILGIITAAENYEDYKFYLESLKNSWVPRKSRYLSFLSFIYLEAVLQDGETIWLSGKYSYYSERDLEKIELLGRALSQLLGVEFYPYKKWKAYYPQVVTDETGKKVLQVELLDFPSHYKAVPKKVGWAVFLIAVFLLVILPLILALIFL